MSWNHRVIAHEHNGDVWFGIHEVYYKDGEPVSYTESSVGIVGDSIKDLVWTLSRMTESLQKDILCADNKFPQIYERKR